MEQSDSDRPFRNPYRIRAGRAWALIRLRYLRGESAPKLARAFKVTEYAIRKRIKREGWSKRSLAEAEEIGMPDPDEALAELEAADAAGADEDWRIDPVAAARAALGRAARLMRDGEMTAAAEAARVADLMARAAARLEGDGTADDLDDEAELQIVQRKVEEMIAEARAEGAREARGG